MARTLPNDPAVGQLIAIDVDRGILKKLRPAAIRRHCSVPQLCRALLETVANEGLVIAVLGDDDD